MKLSAILFETEPERSRNFKDGAVRLLLQVARPEFQDWEAFCPTLAFELLLRDKQRSGELDLKKSENLKRLSDEQVIVSNFTTANLALRSARDFAMDWLSKSKGLPVEPAARQNLRQIQATCVEFHRKLSHSAYFEGHNLCDYLSTLGTEFHEYKSTIRECEAFLQRNERFEIPRIKERLLNVTVCAAEQLGMVDKRNQFVRLYNQALKECPFWQKTWGLTDSAVLNPDFYSREIRGSTSDQAAWGDNALKVILIWAKHEWDNDLLSTESWKKVFGFAFAEINEEALETFDPQDEFMKASPLLFGKEGKPSDTDTFLSIIQRLQAWLRIPERPPSRGARLFALKIILKSRVYRFGEFLRSSTVPPNSSDFLRYEKESQVMRDVEDQEIGSNAEAGAKTDQDDMMAIHITLMQCYLQATGESKSLTDDQLARRISDARAVIKHFKESGRRLSEYHALVQMIRLSWQRHLLFGSVPADSCIDALEAAERVVNSIKRDISTTDAPGSLLAKVKLSEDFDFREHYNYALVATLKAFQDTHAAAQAAHSKGEATQSMFDKINPSYEVFREWTYRSKGRGLTDVLGAYSDQVREFAKQYQKPTSLNSILQKESDLVKAIENSPLDREFQLEQELTSLRESMRGNSEFKELMEFKDGVTISKPQIDALLKEIDENVVIVDFIHFAYQGNEGTLKVILYRKNKLHYPLNIPNITLDSVSSWVSENLNNQQTPLADQSGTDKLQQLKGLVEPLIKTPRPLAIKPGETIIFCPTGDINRIPLHAIQIDGVPLIERNPVLYCQSLTTLRYCFQLLCNRNKSTERSQNIVINPMPDYYHEDTDSTKVPTPVASSETVAEIAKNLGASLQHGFDLKSGNVSDALKGSSLIHYHGHAWYSTASPLDSALLLNEDAYRASCKANASTISLRASGVEMLAARDIFGLRLVRPALSVLIACGSGVTQTSKTDDVLGLPTAFIYAGSSAVVSTLWYIDDSDGAAFAKYFYDELWKQKASLPDQSTTPNQDRTNPMKNCVNLAKALQAAVIMLRKGEDGSKSLSPYHWAPFVLNGFWMAAGNLFPERPVAGSENLHSLPRNFKEKEEL